MQQLSKETTTKRLVSSLLPGAAMAVLFVLSQVIQPVGPWYVLRMIFAVAGLLIVPGYVFAKCALREKIDLFLFLVPVFGFLFQLGIILVIYAAEPLLTSSGLTFPDMFISLSFVALCGLAFVGHFTFESEISGRRLLKQSLPILILLFVGVVPRLVLMGDTSTPATDGALYLSQARNAVLTGNFNAIVSNDSPVISNWTTLGLSTHSFAVFGIVLFFLMGDISYLSGKLMALGAGLMLIVVAYYLALRLHSPQAGLVAGLIVALHPWLMFWSVVLYGPEILAALWILFFFLLLAISNDSLVPSSRLTLSSASVAIALIGSDYPVFWSLFLALPFVLRFLGPFKGKAGVFLASSVVVVLSLPFAYYAGRPDFYILTKLPQLFWITAFVPPSAYLLLRATGKLGSFSPVSRSLFLFFVALNMGLQVLLARTYYLVQTSQPQFVSIGTSGLLESTQWYSSLRSLGLDKLLVAQFGFWQLLAVSSGLTLFVLGIILFSLNIGWKQRVPFILALVAGSLFYSLGAIGKEFFDPQWWNYRLVIGFVPILAVLASFGCKLPIMRRLFKINRILVSIIPGLLIILVVLLPLAPLYTQANQSMANFDAQRYWGPVSEWATTSTPSGSRFLVYDPYSWNWISDRPSIALRSQGSLDLETVTGQIKNYKADYLVVDSANSATRSLVNTYFGNPAFTPPGFYLVFTNTVSGLTISVYDVRQIASFNGPLHLSRSALIEDTEAFEGTPNTPYGNLTVLSVGWGADLSEARIYLKFDTSQVPANKLILSYRLTFFVAYSYASSTVSDPLRIDGRIVGNDWREGTLTWTTQPNWSGVTDSKADLRPDFHGNVTINFQGPFNSQSQMSIVIYPRDSPSLFRYAAVLSKENPSPYPGSSLPWLDVIYSNSSGQ